MKQNNKEIGYFDVLKSVITKTNIQDADIDKHFAPFMTMKWLSVDPKTCYSINALNTTRGLKYIPKKDEYIYIKKAVTLPKNKYIPFDKTLKGYDNIILTLSIHFKCGKRTTEDYIKIMGGKRIVSLLEKIAQINNIYVKDARILKLREDLKSTKKELLKIKGLK